MPKLYYQGHASLRITANDGRVIYIDPFVGEGYDLPADIVLITHAHGDHNQIRLITQKPECRVITHAEALANGRHNAFDLGGIAVEAVEAGNVNHDPKECVGFILTVDGVTIYVSGDTSKTAQMGTFAARGLDYAVLCLDGVYNMDLDEGAECARIIGAKHNIPAHIVPVNIKPGALFDRERAERWDAPNKLILDPGQEIELIGGQYV